MKNLYYVFILSTILLSCLKKNETRVLSYPNKKAFEKNKLYIEINVEKFKSYYQLKDLIDSLNCANKTPIITLLSNNNDLVKIIPINICPEKMTGSGLIKEKNIIRIDVDSEYYDCCEEFKIDSLIPQMEKYYLNKSNSYIYPENPDKVWINISADSLSKIENVKKYLTELSKGIEKIRQNTKDSLSLNINFGRYNFIPPPPPPPRNFNPNE